MSTTTTYIYGLLCPIEEKVRDVGRGVKTGVSKKKMSAKQQWIADLAEQDRTPRLVILEVVCHEPSGRHGKRHEAAIEAEQRWIGRLLAAGHPLLNHEKQLFELRAKDDEILEEAIALGREMFGSSAEADVRG